MKLETKKEQFSNPLYLESGRILEPYGLVYETYGEMNEDKSNVILITHALSGSHHAAGWYDGDRKPGWWNGLIGDERLLILQDFLLCVSMSLVVVMVQLVLCLKSIQLKSAID